MAVNNCYLGQDGKARKTKKIYVGVDNKARICQYAYVGVNGVAKRMYAYQISIPSVSGDYTYNGEEQSVVINNLDKEFVNISGTTKATNAGTYTFTCSLKDPLTEWEDGTTADKVISWSIAKASATIIIEKTGATKIVGSYTYTEYQYECKAKINGTDIILHPAFSILAQFDVDNYASGNIEWWNYTNRSVDQNKYTFIDAREDIVQEWGYHGNARATFTISDTTNFNPASVSYTGTNYFMYRYGEYGWAYGANLTI